MTPANQATLREHAQSLWALLVAVVGLVRQLGGVAQATAALNTKPGAKPMTFTDALTWGNVKAFAGQIEAASGPLADIKAVLLAHGKDAAANKKVGIDVLMLVKSVAGPYAPAIALLILMLEKGSPHNSGEGGIGVEPSGSNNVSV